MACANESVMPHAVTFHDMWERIGHSIPSIPDYSHGSGHREASPRSFIPMIAVLTNTNLAFSARCVHFDVGRGTWDRRETCCSDGAQTLFLTFTRLVV